MTTVAIIPARGGSKGIPRKNLRPLSGKPLIFYAINAALRAHSVNEVVVSTDDDEVALFAERFGAKVVRRPEELANDSTTLDPVIVHAVEVLEKEAQNTFDIVLTLQPTSPLVRSDDIDSALKKFEDQRVDTVLSVVDDRHLCWGIEGGRCTPRYTRRVNRQQLPENYKETGAIIACRRSQLHEGSRIGKRVLLHVMPHERSFDIDSLADLYLCEAMLNHRRIVFTVIGRPEIGMGHAYRVALLAHELVKHELIIICEENDKLAYDYLKSLNYQVLMVPRGGSVNKILEIKPDMVINDILDTRREDVLKLKRNGIRVVNFEDMGEGSEEADLVINALYPHQVPSTRHLTGAKYFCLRDEFLHLPETSKNTEVRNVLLTFGGTDENNLSTKVLEAILPESDLKGIEIDLVVGPGFQHHKEVYDLLSDGRGSKVNFVTATSRISDYMAKADLAFTSGGRTVFELTAVGVPTIVICQNLRETTHSFASSEHGIINMGLCDSVDRRRIEETFSKVLRDHELRQTMKKKLAEIDLNGGKERVVERIVGLLSGVNS